MSATTEDLRGVLARLEKLERQNRRMRWAGLMFLSLMGAITLMGQTAPGKGTIEAQGFLLRDESGKVLASLGRAHANGMTLGPALRIFDSAGKLRAEFGLPDASKGPALNLISENEKVWAHLEPHELDIGPRIGNGSSVSLMVGTEGDAVLLLNKEGMDEPTCMVLQLATDGSPSITLADKTGRLLLGATKAGKRASPTGELRPTPSIGFFGPNWESLWEAPRGDANAKPE